MQSYPSWQALTESLKAGTLGEAEARLRSAISITLDKDLNPSSLSSPVRARKLAVSREVDTGCNAQSDLLRDLLKSKDWTQYSPLPKAAET